MDNEFEQVGQDITDFAFLPITQVGGTHHASLEINMGVSNDGLTLALGTPLSTNSDGKQNAGSVKIYAYAAKTWSQMGSVFESDDANDLCGAAVAVSGDGASVAIGFPGNNFGAGRVDIFYWNQGTAKWVEKGLPIAGERRYDGFGGAVALSTDGTRLAVGATGFDGDVQGDAWHEDAGKTRLYEWISSTWIPMGFGASGEAAGDKSGSSLGLSGDGTRVVIASAGNDGGALGVDVDAGAARVSAVPAVPSASSATVAASNRDVAKVRRRRGR